MVRQPSNKELAQKIDSLDKSVDKKLNSMDKSINKFKSEVAEKIQPMHDYLVGKAAIEKAAREKGTDISSLLPDVIKLLLLLGTIIAALVGAKAIQ